MRRLLSSGVVLLASWFIGSILASRDCEIVQAQLVYAVASFCLFVTAWCCTVLPGIGLVSIAIFCYFLLPFFQLELLLRDRVLFLVGSLLAYVVTSRHRATVEFLNTSKTVFFDWLLFPLVTVFVGIGQLLNGPAYFFPFLAYLLGSNVVALSLAKLAEQAWLYFQPATGEIMHFCHLMAIERSSWREIRFQQLLLACWLVGLLTAEKLSVCWSIVENWQVAFLVGLGSTIVLYIAPIAVGGALTPTELKELRDL
eukprot:TRINITY_DN15198_c0_g1_i1.p1 TRINITY_DN15198_c0_g1~~TRINITY_DN15198_c0_g1_i1.p1  ORF type:complete len:255 (-),score=5.88 TRINITY_DN15198_c0_g1_i1:167-931(-)